MPVQISEKNELIQYVAKGREDFFSSSALFSPLPGADLQKIDGGGFYYSTGLCYAPCNGVIGEKIPSEKEITHAIDFFNQRKLPFIWWSSSKELEHHGFQFGGILTGIVLDLTKGIGDLPVSSHLTIQMVSSDKEMGAFAATAANAFGMEHHSIEQFQAVNAAGMKKGELTHFLAFIEGKPVGAVSLSTSTSSAGIWNLATHPDHRKQGVGTALVHAALREAKKRHYKQVMAILMPKGMAWGLFMKLGFEQVCEFPFYVYGISVHELEK
jgi:GNAT superfamily N-acetyltransferase